MKRAALLLVLAGCSSAPPPVDDPEQVAVDFLTRHVFDAPEALRDRFVEGVDPQDLPLRLVVDYPSDYRFLDVWRLRMVDGRAVVTALVELSGEPNTLDVWFEHRNGAWRVAGWSHVPRSEDPAEPAPPGGADLPVPLASATFRHVDEAPALALDAPAAVDDPAAARVRVGFQRPQVTGACPPAAVQRHLAALDAGLRRCWADAHPPPGARGGRLTFGLKVGADGGASDVHVQETTLLLPGLTECVESAVAALPGWPKPPAGNCAVQVALTFEPAK